MAATTSGDASAGLDSALQEAMAAIAIIRLTKICNLSSTVLYIYDIATTYDREVTFMWNSKLSVGKVLYFILRYCTLCVIVATNIIIFLPRVSNEPLFFRCTIWVRFYWIMGAIVCTLVEFALQMRIYAMYNRSRRIFLLLSTSLFCVLSTLTIICVFVMKDMTVSFVEFGAGTDMHICIVDTLPNSYKAFWAPAIVNEMILFGLALYKGIQSFRAFGRASPSRLLNLLVRDSIVYFFAAFVLYIGSWITWNTKGRAYLSIPSGFDLTMQGILGSRLLIHLVEYYSERELTVQWAEDSHPSNTSSSLRHVKVENRIYERQQDIELHTYESSHADRISL